jgi:hypothetical protein
MKSMNLKWQNLFKVFIKKTEDKYIPFSKGIDIKGHKNLRIQNNVPFEKLPKWFQDAETKNAVVRYDNYTFLWHGGV